MKARLLILFLALSAHSVEAAPFENTGMGGAVFSGPTHPHLSSLWINPAALAFAPPGWSFHLGESTRHSYLRIKRTSIDALNNNSLVSHPAESTHTLSPGGLMGVLIGLNDNKFHLGLALSTPNSKNFANGPSDWNYHTNGGHFLQSTFSLAGSWSFAGDRIVAGLGGTLGVWSSMRYKFDTDTALTDVENDERNNCDGVECGFNNPSKSRSYDFDVDQLGITSLRLTLSLGLALKLANRTWIIASYSQASSEPALSGSASIQQPGENSIINGKGEIRLDLGNSYYLGFRMPMWTRFDLITFLRIRQNSQTDVWNLGTFGAEIEESEIPEWIPRFRGLQTNYQWVLGLEEVFSDTIRWGTRVRLETQSVPTQFVTPLITDGHSATVAGGVEFKLTKHWFFSGGLDLTYYLPRDVTESGFSPLDYVSCVDSGFDFEQCSAVRDGRAGPTALGNYQQLGSALHLALRYESF